MAYKVEQMVWIYASKVFHGTFLVKTALLSPDAPKDEVTVLEVETIGYKKEKVRTTKLMLGEGF